MKAKELKDLYKQALTAKQENFRQSQFYKDIINDLKFAAKNAQSSLMVESSLTDKERCANIKLLLEVLRVDGFHFTYGSSSNSAYAYVIRLDICDGMDKEPG
jgi:DNA-binding LacI/PurR family transcriptional regulator